MWDTRNSSAKRIRQLFSPYKKKLSRWGFCIFSIALQMHFYASLHKTSYSLFGASLIINHQRARGWTRRGNPGAANLEKSPNNQFDPGNPSANLLDYYLHPTSRLMWWLEIPKVFLTATPAQTQMQPYGVYGLQRPSHVFLTMLLRSWRSLRLILMIRNGFMPSIMQADGIISRF